MADLANITRRLFLSRAPLAAAGALVATTVLAETAKPVFVKVGSPTVPEHPWVAARRLARELAKVLEQVEGGTLMAMVEPSSATYPVLFVDREYYSDQMRRLEALDDGPLLADDVTGTTAFADWTLRKGVHHNSI